MERYYLPRPEENLLGPQESDHALRVMRRRVGDRILLFDGAGTEWVAEVRGRSGRRLFFRKIAERKVPPPPGKIGIAQALLKAKAMDLFFQKATELGVTEIFPLLCTRSVERREGMERKHARWIEIAIAAAKQSRRAWLPTIHSPIELGLLGRETSSYPLRLFGSLQEGAPSLRVLLAARRTEAQRGVLSLIGPEGDLTPAEQAVLEEEGFLPASLGPTVLRSETAALFSAAVFLYELAGGGVEENGKGRWQETF
ncbi:RsmE family RNA methyltransferase [Methylacidimicrobium tartarophylax]|uniref:Ribosomal RNA small subunit methyltransferase E n=1 Tax=Methylacidimicrobium tartarophylax TaxID=1041768 RepID=A0A5E6M6R4_9BACT|nr:RsmE family RNA methyltransferase [Methylacidimicrobium tartarophylax]VVM04630.1 Ribosomal RNA small subunit methyltransferase E [Methylacidimicrobium tartarophylax]